MYWTWLYVWLFVLLVSRQVSSISVILTTCVVLIDLLVNAMWAVFQLYWRLVFYWLIYWSMPWGQYFSYIKRHSCWDKSYLNKDNLLLRWSHCYKNYMVVIAIWLRNIHISNNNGSFTVYLDFFISLSLARIWPNLTVYMSNTVVSYKKQGLLTLREHKSSPHVFGEVRVAHLSPVLFTLFVFVCV
jgi:hypothetical protein